MKIITTSIIMCTLVLLSSISLLAAPKKLAYVMIEESIEIKAPVDKVWSKLVTSDGASLICSLKGAKGGQDCSKLGSTLTGALMGDKGTYVVTGVTKGSELRMTFEPEKGHYICHAAVKLSKTKDGTMVTVTEGYSDEKPATVDKYAAETEKAVKAGLKKFAEYAAKP